MSKIFRRVMATMHEYIILAAIAAACFYFGTPFPAAHQAGSWRERDPGVWHFANQMYGRAPEELTAFQLDNVKRWSRCVELAVKHDQDGPQSLSDDDCRAVVETLDDLCPNRLCPILEAHGFYFPIYQACQQRLTRKSDY